MLYYIEDCTKQPLQYYYTIIYGILPSYYYFDVYSSGYGLSLSVSYYCIYYMRHAAIDLLAR